jgi:4-hydroxybenzoate polyprenyltransferase
MNAPATKDPAGGRFNRMVIVGLSVLATAVLFGALFRRLGLPGSAVLGPVYGVALFTGWLLSPRPIPSRKQAVTSIVALFLVCPAVMALVHWLLDR